MATADGLWHQILKVTEAKQKLFLDRVLFVHGVKIKKRASKSQSVRMDLATWDRECSNMCALQHVLEQMDAQKPLFDAVMGTARQRILEGCLWHY